jgi:hypothetical protein
MYLRFGKKSFLLLWVAALLAGSAPVWSAAGNEGARRLSPQGLRNLEAFTRLLGYVHFFHPSDQAATADWDKVAIAGVQRTENATGPVDLARSLQDFFQPLAPTLRVYVDGAQPAVPAELFPPSGTASPSVTYWRHFGVQTPASIPGTYSNVRLVAPAAPPASTGLPPTASPLAVSLGGGVSALLPLSVYTGAQGTIPASAAPLPAPDKPEGWAPSGNDRATRLAGVALAWTTLQHFYSYFDIVQADWPGELDRALLSAAQDPDERAFVDTLRRLMAALRDGHARVTHPSWVRTHQLPLVWVWLDEQLVVTWADPAGAPGLEPGDVVLALNGRPAQQVYREELALAPGATPQHLRSRALEAMLIGAQDEEVRLRVLKHHGGTQEMTVRRTYPVDGPGGIFLTEPRPEKIAEIRPGIFYVDLDRTTSEDILGAADRLAAARGVIFDLRTYPFHMEWIEPLELLATSDFLSPHIDAPLVFRPDRQGWRYLDLQWPDSPIGPHIGGRVAFLTSGACISYGEDYMTTVEAYHLGDIVGETTGGTDGAVNFIPLPGGYLLRFTGELLTKQDGSRLHGVGVAPTVPVARTYEGIAAGRDEVLEKAIEVVSR